MGVDVELKVRNLCLLYWKSFFDKEKLGVFFTDNDLVITKNVKYNTDNEDEKPDIEYKYSTTVQKAIDRLDSIGFTVKKAKQEFDKKKYRCLDYIGVIYNLKIKNDDYDLIQKERTRKYVTFSKWCNSVWKYAQYGLEKGLYLSFLNEYEAFLIPKTECDKIVFESLKNDMNSYFGCLTDEFNPLFTIRIILEKCNPTEELSVDITEMVGWTYSSIDEMRLNEPNEKTIVLVEGTNDKAILEFALKNIYPHLYDLYYFMDFELDSGKKRKGGADTVVINLKAFVFSKLQARFIGLFDNDTAGRQAKEKLLFEIGKTPENIRAICYPNIVRANRYPTIGINGKIIFDNINGRACSIELYLPDFLIKNEAGFPPIEWESRMKTKIGDKDIQDYQGIITHKAETEKNFTKYKEDIEKGKKLFDIHDWKEMKSLLDSIINAFNT